MKSKSSNTEIPWVECDKDLPPIKMEVETKIDDASGARNITNLVRVGELWFLPDMSMYVFYTPTHWRILGKNT